MLFEFVFRAFAHWVCRICKRLFFDVRKAVKLPAIRDKRAERIVKASGRRAGIMEGVSPHWVRHAYASHAMDRGAKVHLVQATLGHASVAITGRYLHARPDESSAMYLVT